MRKKTTNRKIFYLILVITPLIILTLLELALRIFNFGNHYPLFIPAQAMPGYMQPNPAIVYRYFSSPELAPNIKPDTFYFKQDKKENSFRIVILGGSTAAGFPFGRFGSLQGMLQQRFKRLYPDQDIEIINTAMSAINSYALLDFSDEIIAIQPDLILIYAGHNEYLGLMGVGSSFAVKGSRATTLLFLKLKDLKLFQLTQSIFSFFQSDTEKINLQTTKEQQRNLMAKIAKEKDIPLNSKMYNQGIEQFSDNLDLILTKYQNADIPVIISTLASNEKDQPPFSSSNEKENANDYFEKAKALESIGQFEQARKFYIQAKDFDRLRFRAPSEFNRIIRKKAKLKGVSLVNYQQQLRNESKNRIIGFESMYEHLHPNARGYFLLAETFSRKIIADHYLAVKAIPYARRMAWQDIPLTQVDRLAADFRIKSLTSDYPFKKNKQKIKYGSNNHYEDRMAVKKLAGENWLPLHQDMLEHYQKENDTPEAAKIASLIFDAFPNQDNAAWVAGQLYLSLNDTRIALYYYRKATLLKPRNTRYLMSYAYTLYLNQRVKQSLEVLNRVLKINPNHIQAKAQKQRLSRIKVNKEVNKEVEQKVNEK